MGDYNDALLRNQNAAVQARTKGGTRANVIQLKLIGQSHPTGLTANLLKLFEPRPPLEFKPPPEKRKCLPYTGMAQFVSQFAEPGDPEYAPPVQKGETPAERKARIHKIRLEEGAKKAAEELETYDPNNDPNVSGDPYKTLFVARLSYETTESRIKREFEAFGPIKRVRLVTDKSTSKPRGYAFIEYAHTRDMKAAYKQADGKKIDNRRVLVDVERGRTVPNWRPRRLGGGLGTTRVGGEELNQKNSGREIVQSAGPPSRSEEPRVRDDRDRDREKSRERVRESREREREPEKVRERSQDRTRDREHREERHHRDRDRTRDKDRSGRDSHRRDRDRGGRDRGRDHDRDHREKSRDRHRERKKDKDREYDAEYEYDKVESKHEKDRAYDPADEDNHGGWYEQSERKRKRPEGEHVHYDYAEAPVDDDRCKENDGYDRYDQVVDEDKYGFEQDAADPREKDRTYQRSERSRSRDY